MNTNTQSLLMLLGRLAMGALFLVAGIRKIMFFAGTVGYMTKNGVPFSDVLAVLTIALELIGGLMLVFGWKTRLIAGVLAIFIIVITPIFHGFWSFEPAQYNNQLNHFLKNLAILGGLLYIAAAGAGGSSMDGKDSRMR